MKPTLSPTNSAWVEVSIQADSSATDAVTGTTIFADATLSRCIADGKAFEDTLTVSFVLDGQKWNSEITLPPHNGALQLLVETLAGLLVLPEAAPILARGDLPTGGVGAKDDAPVTAASGGVQRWVEAVAVPGTCSLTISEASPGEVGNNRVFVEGEIFGAGGHMQVLGVDDAVEIDVLDVTANALLRAIRGAKAKQRLRNAKQSGGRRS